MGNKTFELRPIHELLAIVRQDFRKFDDEGYIDEGVLVKTIMYCNDRLGIPLREVKSVCLTVNDYKAELPLDFEKLFYTGGITATNTMTFNTVDPFSNNVDTDVIYNAKIDKDCIGCEKNVNIVIERKTKQTVINYQNLIPLTVFDPSKKYCHTDCPNNRLQGKYIVEVTNTHIETPFRTGEIFVVYLAAMRDAEGNILFPFHPVITPYYEWMLKEKIIMDAIFNGDSNYGEQLKLAQVERGKAWLDAFDMTTSKEYGEYVNIQRKKELNWYHQYFKYFQ